MKLIIAGGRDFVDYSKLDLEVKIFMLDNKIDLKNFSIISGHARGADQLGERFAHKYKIPLEIYPADWNRYGNRAGPLRNEEMAKVATHCICFWDGKSSGTKNMIGNCKKYNLIYKIIEY